MYKIKSPLVKVLRKAGYSTKEAMNITHDALYAYLNQREEGLQYFNCLASRGGIIFMFDWSVTDEGHNHWSAIHDRLTAAKVN